MDRNVDIGQLLDEWPFDPNSNVRHIRSREGSEKIQVRIEQGPFRGILQMDLEGRPDSERPHGYEFALDFYQAERDQHAGKTSEFRLNRSQVRELFAESKQIYERYSFLLQLADFDRVIRDTNRNMALFRFVHEYAEHPDDRNNLERWWPYILRVNGTARAMLELSAKGPRQARAIVASTREEIRALKTVDALEYRIELDRSLEALEDLDAELKSQMDPSPQELLEEQLAAAIANEQYEKAARLRDELNASSSQQID